MTDAHCHVSGGDPSVREFLVGRDFFGVHPWESPEALDLDALRQALVANPHAGVGEIGLDRLRSRDISAAMRDVFERQLDLAFELHRAVTLHGAKCWGQVVSAVLARMRGKSGMAFLFHGFSRSDGLIPDIVALNGFISVGPAVLNDHAVNYRELVKKIPLERLLVETDRTDEKRETCPDVGEVLAEVARIRAMAIDEAEAVIDRNAQTFMGGAM